MRWTLPLWAFAAACSFTPSPREDEIKVAREMADLYYRSGKFFDAANRFGFILKKNPEDWEALIGYANSSREVGNEFYHQATGLAAKGDAVGVQQAAQRGFDYHKSSWEAFSKALDMRPDDPEALFGLGLFYYHRASGAYRLFVDVDKEQDVVKAMFKEAQGCFEKYVAQRPSSYNGHRYLGLILIGVERPADARVHIEFFLKSMQDLKQQIEETKPQDDEERAKRDDMLGKLKKDIEDAKGVLRELDETKPKGN